MTIHELKTHMPYFQAIIDGDKTFEVRLNDRGYNVGDILVLKEYNPETKTYTGRQTTVGVKWMMPGGFYGISKDYCVMSIQPVSIQIDWFSE